MIKWFDADRFLPGKNSGHILIRYSIFGEHHNTYHEVGTYEDGEWLYKEDELSPMEDGSLKVTHWAFIEEPI